MHQFKKAPKRKCCSGTCVLLLAVCLLLFWLYMVMKTILFSPVLVVEGSSRPFSGPPPGQNCEEWLEKEDAPPYKRDFSTNPVVVIGLGQSSFNVEGSDPCDVGCIFEDEDQYNNGDAVEEEVSSSSPSSRFKVQRTLESVLNYPKFNHVEARRRGVHITCNTNLSSDVPASYGSWREVNFVNVPSRLEAMCTVPASMFITNCGARSFRLEAAMQLLEKGIEIHSFGKCMHNANESLWIPDKTARQNRLRAKEEIMRHYRFHLAFENTQEEGYATEKIYYAWSAGVVPVIIGPPDIRHLAPSNNSYLAIDARESIPEIAKRMVDLMHDDAAYTSMLAWKKTGGTDEFKALMDTHIVHSSCRICLKIADMIRWEEEGRILSATDNLKVDPNTGDFLYASGTQQPRPCRCLHTSEGEVLHHAFVRERGTFHYVSIFLLDTQVTRQGLYNAITGTFISRRHMPMWTRDRDRRGRTAPQDRHERERLGFVTKFSPDLIQIYSVYPAERYTVNEVIFGGVELDTDERVRDHFTMEACPKLEVIFK